MGYYARGDNCYGRGDYYRGDYYRGDPGIFSGIGKALGGIAKAAVGLLPGPVGAIARAVTGAPRQQLTVGPGPGALGLPQIGVQQPLGPPTEFEQPVGTMLPRGFVQQCGFKGYRPNKSGYYKQVQKGNPASAVYVPKGSVCVKTRRINIANPRALRRAVRRAQGFAKMARRVMSFVDARAPRGRAKFKRRR